MKTKHIQRTAGAADATSLYVSSELKTSFVKQFLNAVSSGWIYLANLGVRDGQKATEIKKIRLTNQFALLGLIICLVELPGFIYLELTTSVILVGISCILLSCVLLLSGKRLYHLAKILHIIIINGILLYTSMYLGNESGLYLYYFAVIILPFILFDLSEKLSITICLLVIIISVYFLMTNEATLFRDKTISPDIKYIIFLSSLFGAFLSIIFCVYSLVKENYISEKSLSESETLFKGLLDAAPDSTIITDTKGYITLCNKRVEAVFGYSASELLGEHINVLIPAQYDNQTSKHFSILNSPENYKNAGDLFISKKDGTKVAVEISQNSYLAKSGAMMILVIRDITERKKNEQELMQFSYVVSHDLKAPLRAIFKLSEWIEEELGPAVSGTLQKNLTLLRGRVFRLEALINGLLEYAKVGRTNSKKEVVNTLVLIDEVIDMLAPPSNVTINIQANLPVFETAKIPFQQVFFNLLSNAIKYNDKEKGVINITANTSEKFYEFSVEDNGMGIDPIYHEKVFVIFQTLESRDKVEGTGIGLAILKKSIEDMGGTIRLQSELGKGARFTFTWPKNKTHNEKQNKPILKLKNDDKITKHIAG